MVITFDLFQKIKKTAIKINGPYGITLFLFFINEIIETGSAKHEDKKMLKIPNEGCKINPTKNISFMSAPPNVSFLKILFPNNIIIYIKENNNIPDKIEKKVSFNPNPKNLTTITATEKNNVTSSGIIR